jgi:Cu2+-exporting ATPase
MHVNHGEYSTNVREHSGHNRHAGHSVAKFRDKFWLSLALTFPVVFWSDEVQRWLDYHAPSVPGSRFIPAILGTIILVYGGSIFIQGAWRELSGRQPGMMTLISLAIVVAFSASLAATFGVFKVDVWWELATLISVMLLGHWLEMKAVTQAQGALDALAALLPDSAERVTESGIDKVPLAQLRVADVVLVRPGSRVPADGIVLEGTADVDESPITGESRPISKASGAAVVGGTVAAGGSLRVRVTAVGEETAISGIMRLVAAAQTSGSRAQALADRAAALLFYIAVTAGTLTLAYWSLVGDKEHALVRTATVFVIACPHALGLAIPLVIAIRDCHWYRRRRIAGTRLSSRR